MRNEFYRKLLLVKRKLKNKFFPSRNKRFKLLILGNKKVYLKLFLQANPDKKYKEYTECILFELIQHLRFGNEHWF